MAFVDPAVRNAIASAFRERICQKLGTAPWLHQRQVWAAADGIELTGRLKGQPDVDPTARFTTIRLESETCPIVEAETRPLPSGPARFLLDLGAFKVGKSWGAGMFAAGFGAIPGAVINLVGLEYSIVEPEFNYIIENLLSDRGMGLKFSELVNRPKDGKMVLTLQNGCRFEARSWERREALKGKEIDLYVYCEAYQLPGVECFTAFSQNLRARKGLAYFATTPDRPWIQAFHELGHGEDPEWHCTCGVGAESNPLTFDQKSKDRDRKLMTREKFQIHYEGKLGQFVGRVFNFQRGDEKVLFDPARQFPAGLPAGWAVQAACDTGTFYSALIVAFDPEGTAWVLEEFPNYRYIAGEAEREETITIPQWSAWVNEGLNRWNCRPWLWADNNSQFKYELRDRGLFLMAGTVPLEARTEITREYFQHGRIRLSKDLSILPYELESAKWPDEASLSGKFSRLKRNDHTLDPLEHILSHRPIGRMSHAKSKGSWAASQGLNRKRASGNVHLGRF